MSLDICSSVTTVAHNDQMIPGDWYLEHARLVMFKEEPVDCFVVVVVVVVV